jgi:hypothetical protein
MATKAEILADPKSCWNQAPDDAPVFVFIPSDVLAPDTLRWWSAELMRRSNISRSIQKAMAALEDAVAFEAYAALHGSGLPGSGWNKSEPAKAPERTIPRYPSA